MAGGKRALLHLSLDGGGKIEQSQCIGDVAPGLSDGLADRILCQPELGEETAVAFSLLDRVKILTLEIFDERSGHGLGIGEIPEEGRHAVQTGRLGGAPSAFARDDLIAIRIGRVGPNEKRLEEAADADGFGKLSERRRIHRCARLEWAGDEAFDRQCPNITGGASWGRIWLTDEGGEPAAEAGRGIFRVHAGFSGLRRFGLGAFPGEKFAGEANIRLGPGRAEVIKEHRLSVAWSLGDADIAGDDRLVDLGAEIGAGIGRDKLGEIIAAIEHRQDDALKPQRRVEANPYEVNGANKMGNALQGEELALQGDKNGVSGDQAIEGEKAQAWRAIDQNKRKARCLAEWLESVAEAKFATASGYELNLRTDETGVGGQE